MELLVRTGKWYRRNHINLRNHQIKISPKPPTRDDLALFPYGRVQKTAPPLVKGFFYASTGILGELELVNIGIGYTLPFKIVGAPWIQARRFADALNKQKLPGVFFFPFTFHPFYGPYSKKKCQGVKIVITDALLYRPLAVQYLLLGMLKTLYPAQVKAKLSSLSASKRRFFSLINGTEEILDCLCKEQYVAWKLIRWDEAERKNFVEKRKKYLLYP